MRDDAVVDAHVHFWDPAELRYPWLDGVPALRRAFLPADHAAAVLDAPVERLVFVEANPTPGEAAREVAFAERLCSGTYPEVALHLFAPKTPWKRAYLQRAFKAWHVGGRGELRDLRAGEEVLIVKRGTGAGQELGGQAFDVLRWDGTCVSLMEDEISFRRPSSAVPANIPFKKLEPSFQSAFAEEKQIELLRADQVRLCDAPAAEKEPGKSKCELSRRQLSLAIAQSVGKGKTLPPVPAIP